MPRLLRRRCAIACFVTPPSFHAIFTTSLFPHAMIPARSRRRWQTSTPSSWKTSATNCAISRATGCAVTINSLSVPFTPRRLLALSPSSDASFQTRSTTANRLVTVHTRPGSADTRRHKCSTLPRSATSISTRLRTTPSAFPPERSSTPGRSAAPWSAVCCRGGIPARKLWANTAPSSEGRESRPADSPGTLSSLPRSRTPLPLTWFDNPRARSQASNPDPDEVRVFFAHLAGSHLAGMPNRPTGTALARTFRSPPFTPAERDHVWHVFACMPLFDLPRLLLRGGLSLYEVARAIHLSQTLRPHIIAWLNNFGVRPGAPRLTRRPPIDVGRELHTDQGL